MWKMDKNSSHENWHNKLKLFSPKIPYSINHSQIFRRRIFFSVVVLKWKHFYQTIKVCCCFSDIAQFSSWMNNSLSSDSIENWFTDFLLMLKLSFDLMSNYVNEISCQCHQENHSQSQSVWRQMDDVIFQDEFISVVLHQMTHSF